ncbi:hypothetical protein CEXT_404831 [Caerostris extrusa]|uniref:Uncharacterized protein n=1 Tax=Caerostris extrusa TaxID=172846 RepID=A0AAV4NUV5_CAEEX|nr:hypothetical protein CEXT_404831 [Caerostris extrusa]
MSHSVYVSVIKLRTDRQTSLLISLSCMLSLLTLQEIATKPNLPSNLYSLLHRYPVLQFQTITQPAKAVINSGDLQPPSHPSEEAEWTQKPPLSLPPSANLETITQPAKALVNSGTYHPTSHPSEGSRVDTKGNFIGTPRQSSFRASCPDSLMRKRFPTREAEWLAVTQHTEMKSIEHDDTTQPPLIEGMKASISESERIVVLPFTLADTLC